MPADRAADRPVDRAADHAVDRPVGGPSPRRRRRRTGAVLAGAALVLATACSGAESTEAPHPPATSPGTSSTTTTTIPTTTTAPPTTDTTRKPRPTPSGPPGPLTGAPTDLPGYQNRPAVVVKIDNYDPNARPQAGITLADVVYEEKVEGPLSRFAAVFQGSDADQVGPVRSARSTDVQIVGPLNTPGFAYSGANGAFLSLLSIAPLIDVGAGARGGAYWRGGDKPVPHNLYTSTRGLMAGLPLRPPPPLWPFRAATEAPGPGARPTVSATYHFGGNILLVTWTWDPAEGGWVRTQNGSTHLDLDNWPITVQNLVIQYVPYQASFTVDGHGNPIPEAELGGQGRGWVLTGGAAIPATWQRDALQTPTAYLGPDGQPIRFAPGRTWVALVPNDLPARISFADGTVGS